jgi:hypothetical protein
MNIFDPIGYRKENKGQFETRVGRDSWNLMRNGKRIGGTTYVRQDTAEKELKEIHFGSASAQLPDGYEIVKAN